MPKLFDYFPQAKSLISQHALQNLNDLTMSTMHDYIHNTLLPNLRDAAQSELREELEEEAGNNEDAIREQLEKITVNSILRECNLTVLNEETIRQWMHKIGFQFEERKKCFFVDAHEREDVVQDRNAYVKDALEQDLSRHCWIQKVADDLDLKELYEKGELKEEYGHKYIDGNGVAMIEFHVDNHKSFFDWGNENCEYGGCLSVRFPGGRKLVRIGQDEACFNQFASSKSAWVGSKGERGLLPKHDGAGIMISGFTSRELGFGVEWNDELRNKVNDLRAGQTYADEEAAIEVYGRIQKHELEENPFVRYFEYGANYQGYWNSFHMICQTEDVVDVLKVVFDFNEYKVQLVVDHSQGHDRLRVDGLNVSSMNLLYGGRQAMMHDSKLTSEDDFGPFPRSLEEFYNERCKFFRKKTNQQYQDFIPDDPIAATQKLNKNDTQSMHYLATDPGPFYLTKEERETNREDHVMEEVEREKNIDDLKADLSDFFEQSGIGSVASLRGLRKKTVETTSRAAWH